MPACPSDSQIYRDLFGDPDISALFADTAEIRAMMLVEGALAKAQGARGIIPEVSAAAIQRAAMEAAVDPVALTEGAGQSGVPVPALVAAMRSAMSAPEHAQYIHWGATSQDIVDTGMALRLRQALALMERRVSTLVHDLADLADTHAKTPVLARTWGQAAVPTTFGAIVASWGWPMLAALSDLDRVRSGVAVVSLSGAAGTSGALGPEAAAIRADVAEALGLADRGHSWHSTRDGFTGMAAWVTGVANNLGKLGEDLTFHASTGIDEVTFAAAGSSSTMPQKSNPVLPAVLSALARQVTALNTAMQGAAVHRTQRDGAAWMTEWLCLPQMTVLAGRALLTATAAISSLRPNEACMKRNLAATNDMIFAEALSFRLAETMPRPEAQATVKDLVSQATQAGKPLSNMAKSSFQDVDLNQVFELEANLGAAPQEARAFVEAARKK